MNNLHYRVKVRKGGRITIPHQLRKELGWKEGIILECFSENGRIILRKAPEEEHSNPTSKS